MHMARQRRKQVIPLCIYESLFMALATQRKSLFMDDYINKQDFVHEQDHIALILFMFQAI
jgi:hypothetical protein